jgi:predicted RNA-binding Zn-ribbon protein involved in translation (DUF1610 family)
MGYGGLNIVGSTAADTTSSMPLGTGFLLFGLLIVAGGVVLIVVATRKARQENPQKVTFQVDLPGDTKVEQMKCKSCGGALTVDNIKMVQGAPMVTCPFCGTVYQLTEEPKW